MDFLFVLLNHCLTSSSLKFRNRVLPSRKVGLTLVMGVALLSLNPLLSMFLREEAIEEYRRKGLITMTTHDADGNPIQSGKPSRRHRKIKLEVKFFTAKEIYKLNS